MCDGGRENNGQGKAELLMFALTAARRADIRARTGLGMAQVGDLNEGEVNVAACPSTAGLP